MASIEIGAGWVDALERYVEGLQEGAVFAAEEATSFFHERVQEMARADEDWTNLADNIELWSEDGHLVIGVQDQMYASQATLLEYGDKDQPPHPLFRTLTSAARDASDHMRDTMESMGFRDSGQGRRLKGMAT